jgi:hypothetical protein
MMRAQTVESCEELREIMYAKSMEIRSRSNAVKPQYFDQATTYVFQQYFTSRTATFVTLFTPIDSAHSVR